MAEDGQVDPAAPTVDPVTDPVVDPVTEPVTEPVAPAVEPAGQSTPSIVNEKGEFTKDWTNQLEESLKSNQTLKTFVDVQTLAKSYVNLRNLIGKNKIVMPNENSTNEEWSEFYSATGRPDTAEDYNITKPADVPDELFSKDLAQTAQKLFFDLGLNTKQAEGLIAFNTQNILQTVQNDQNTQEMAVTEARENLEKEWGSAYDQRVQWGNVALAKGVEGDQEYQDRLTSKYGNDPDFIRLMSRFGRDLAEHSAVLTAQIETPGDLSQRIREAREKTSYTTKTHPEHEAQVAYVDSLYKERVATRRAR